MGRLGPGLAREAGLAGDAAPAARAGYVRAYDKARAAGDIEAMTKAALGLAATQTFGTVPGRVPAFLHEAYSLARGEQRARLAVALARAWAYGYDPARAAGFAAEALAYAEAHDDPSLLAAALDAQLLVHWGPDDLDERLAITARLEGTVAHVTDVESRMSAHLWRLTTALECLDLPAVRRQVRALDLLAAESGSARVRFFAASRRGMSALLTDDLDAAERARREVAGAGAEAGEADTPLIGHMLAAGIARQAGDVAALAREAAWYEEFGIHEAIPWVVAEAALLWMAAGELHRARALLHQAAGPDFSGIARDLDWLLTVGELTEVAVATGTTALAQTAMGLLAAYAGRGVANGGAAFAGVVSDYLCQASELLGTGDAQQWAARAAGEYERLGASWWLRRLPPAVPGQEATVARGGRPEQAHPAVAQPPHAGPRRAGQASCTTGIRTVGITESTRSRPHQPRPPPQLHPRRLHGLRHLSPLVSPAAWSRRRHPALPNSEHCQTHTHAQLGIFHRGLDGHDDRRIRLRYFRYRTSLPNIFGGQGGSRPLNVAPDLPVMCSRKLPDSAVNRAWRRCEGGA